MSSRSVSWVVALVVTLVVELHLAEAQGGDAPTKDPDQKWVDMHGWLMWVSMGVLFPLGILLIRYSKPQSDIYSMPSARRVWMLFYLHVFVQVFGVLLSTSGVTILIVKLGAAFDSTHQKLGLAVMVLVWLQPFIGLIRPQRGVPARPIWFGLHWVLGTSALFLGVINCFLGIQLYNTSYATINHLNTAFAVLISAMFVLYFLQDKWSYILGQGRMHKPVPQSVAL